MEKQEKGKVPETLRNIPFEKGKSNTYVFSREDFTMQDTEETVFEQKEPDIPFKNKKTSQKKKEAEIKQISFKNIYQQLELLDDQNMPLTQDRFTIAGKLGQGGTARVYEAKDINLCRNVAVKVLTQNEPNNVRNFIVEAQVAARLEHPNIVPIYDILADDKKQVYMTMKRISGYSLKDFIENRDAGKDDKFIPSFNDMVLVFLKVCDALKFAHNKGFIHQDVKPENIMLGEYGEVYLIDWGSSCYEDDFLKVTPSYMSPQQANGDIPKVSDDVYCLGATFFHLLSGRFPTYAKSFDEFWKKRLKGVTDPLPEEIREKIPSQLLAIAKKAMSQKPKDRYPDIEAFAEDLENYQQGQAVSAHEETLWEMLGRWYKRHRQRIWAIATILGLLLGFGFFFYHQKIKEIAYWGKPVYTEKFSDNTWRDKWVLNEANWLHCDGRMVTGKGDCFLMLYKEKIDGSVAIEFDGEMLPGCPPCDLSVVWTDKLGINSRGKLVLHLTKFIFMQLGAYDNTYSMILDQSSRRLDFNGFKLKHGEKYRIRAEVDGKRIKLKINGKTICEAEQTFPPGPGYIGLYGYYEGKAFDNIKIYVKGVPEKASILTIGDEFYRKGLFEEAANQYDRVIRSHPDSDLAHEARYKKGLALYQLGLEPEAYFEWGTLAGTPFAKKVLVYFWKRMYKLGKKEELLKDIESAYLKSDAREKKQIENAWRIIANQVAEQWDYITLRKLLDFQKEFFPENGLHNMFICRQLLDMGEFQEVLDRFPDELRFVNFALLKMGKYQEILDLYQDSPVYKFRQDCVKALEFMGKIDRLEKEYSDIPDIKCSILLQEGKYSEAEKYNQNPGQWVNFLLLQGKPEEALRKYGKIEKQHIFILLVQGKPEEALTVLGDKKKPTTQELNARYQLLLMKLASGLKKKTALAEINKLQQYPIKFDHIIERQLILNPGIRNLLDKGNYQEEYKLILNKYDRRIPSNYYYEIAFLAGNISEQEFRDQPTQMELEKRLLFYKAMKADLDWDKAAASQLYQKYQSIPLNQRGLEPVRDAFIKWRLKELQSKDNKKSPQK